MAEIFCPLSFGRAGASPYNEPREPERDSSHGSICRAVAGRGGGSESCETNLRRRLSMTDSIELETNREGTAVPRTIPDCPSVPAVHSTGRFAQDYHIRLVTPLFGGGV